MTELPVEVQFILQTSRIQVTDEQVAGARSLLSGSADINWGYLLDQANRHRVMPLMARNLLRHGLFFSDAKERVLHSDLFRAALSFQRRRYELLRPAYAEALAALTDAGVDVIVRKGGFLAEHVYPEPGTRPMKDLDLMIHKEQAQVAVEVLTGLGYRSGQLNDDNAEVTPDSREQRMFRRMFVNNLPMMFRLTGDDLAPAAAVDFCLGMFLPGSRFHVPTADLFTRSVPARVAGVDTFTLHPVDFVLDLAAHLYKESTTLRYIHRRKHQRLLQYWDVLGAIAHFGHAFDWERFLACVFDEQITPPVYFVLAHADRLAPGEVPAEVLTALLRHDPGVAEVPDQYGEVDLGAPATWDVPFMTRMFDAGHRIQVPESRSVV